MSTHNTEHPCTIGAQNKHILNSIASAYKCSLELAETGITVLGIEVINSKPAITISPPPKGQISSGLLMIQPHRAGRGRIVTRVADVNGCQVQWQTLEGKET